MLNWNRAINAGFLGAVAMTALMLTLRTLGLTPMDLEMMLGSMVNSTIGMAAWMLGLFMHLGVGAGFGVVYAGIMESLGRSGWPLGLAIAAVHTFVSGFILPLIGALHPLVQIGTMAPPGIFASGLGAPGVFLFIALHLVYGAIVGAFYVVLWTAPEASPSLESCRKGPSTVRRG
jgi:hypothetical protein